MQLNKCNVYATETHITIGNIRQPMEIYCMTQGTQMLCDKLEGW